MSQATRRSSGVRETERQTRLDSRETGPGTADRGRGARGRARTSATAPADGNSQHRDEKDHVSLVTRFRSAARDEEHEA